MTLTITINTDNSAFTGNPGKETARILRELAISVHDYLERDGVHFRKTLRDINGNEIGQAIYSNKGE